jgi:hypothetical protein
VAYFERVGLRQQGKLKEASESGNARSGFAAAALQKELGMLTQRSLLDEEADRAH